MAGSGDARSFWGRPSQHHYGREPRRSLSSPPLSSAGALRPREARKQGLLDVNAEVIGRVKMPLRQAESRRPWVARRPQCPETVAGEPCAPENGGTSARSLVRLTDRAGEQPADTRSVSRAYHHHNSHSDASAATTTAPAPATTTVAPPATGAAAPPALWNHTRTPTRVGADVVVTVPSGTSRMSFRVHAIQGPFYVCNYTTRTGLRTLSISLLSRRTRRTTTPHRLRQYDRHWSVAGTASREDSLPGSA
ncbi:hypothetical protein ABIE52_000088 [Rhodococcus sp. OAS809]